MGVSVHISPSAAGKSQKSRQWLSKGGLVRDDSDDELGVEDHPWEWIYGESESSKTPPKSSKNVDQTPTRKRKFDATAEKHIIGARMGTFKCKVGDAVLLKSPEEGQDWAGLICAFSETNDDDEEEMCVNIMWFVAPQELVKGKKEKEKAIDEAMPNEQYITADFNINPLSSINGSATVMSKDAFLKRYPKGPPKGKTALARYKKSIVCRKGVKQRNGRYTEEFVWDEIYTGPESLLSLLDLIQQQTKGRRRKEEEDPKPRGDNEYKDIPEANESIPSTPQKRRKTTAATPKSSAKSVAAKYTTPTHKRIIIKKPLEFTPLGTRILSPSTIHSSPYQQARSTLHVSSVPTSLPCRENEFSTVYSHLSAAIFEGTGACIYISGTPGTGKTATVREVVAQLSLAVQSEEIDDFSFVEINGMKVTDPHQSYSLLWEALKGDRVSPSHALDLLEREFSTPSPRRIPCVVLMDELDQLVTKNQSVMYNFFNWPALRHSRLIVLAVANTMDLPERTLSNKISSRLGMTRITFPGYTHTQLMSIIQARLENVPGNIVDPDAVQFAARKVAAVSGDARRALDICRRAVEIAEQTNPNVTTNTNLSQTSKEAEFDQENEPTPTKLNTRTSRTTSIPLSRLPNPPPTTTTIPPAPSSNTLGRVTIPLIKRAIHESTSSPLHTHLRSQPLSSKLFLSALLALTRRTGLAETTLGAVTDQVNVTARMITHAALVDDIAILVDGKGKNARVRGMGTVVEGLIVAGVLAVEGKRGGVGERAAKCRLRVGEVEVREGVVGGDGDEVARALGFGS